MQYNHTIDFEKSWKLITLFIGANNLCICCTKGNTSGQTETYEKLLEYKLHLLFITVIYSGVLAQIKREIPRSFVNLVPIFNISGVYEAGQVREWCVILWKYFTMGECPCLLKYVCFFFVFDMPTCRVMREEKSWMSTQLPTIRWWVILPKSISLKTLATGNLPLLRNQEYLEWILLRGENLTSQYFPFIPFSCSDHQKLDCFHPGLDANELFTLAIWNNMFTPEGKKDRGSDIGPSNIPPPICPTQDSVLQ